MYFDLQTRKIRNPARHAWLPNSLIFDLSQRRAGFEIDTTSDLTLHTYINTAAFAVRCMYLHKFASLYSRAQLYACSIKQVSCLDIPSRKKLLCPIVSWKVISSRFIIISVCRQRVLNLASSLTLKLKFKAVKSSLPVRWFFAMIACLPSRTDSSSSWKIKSWKMPLVERLFRWCVIEKYFSKQFVKDHRFNEWLLWCYTCHR